MVENSKLTVPLQSYRNLPGNVLDSWRLANTGHVCCTRRSYPAPRPLLVRFLLNMATSAYTALGTMGHDDWQGATVEWRSLAATVPPGSAFVICTKKTYLVNIPIRHPMVFSIHSNHISWLNFSILQTIGNPWAKAPNWSQALAWPGNVHLTCAFQRRNFSSGQQRSTGEVTCDGWR